jgi:hypothetical protein
MKNEKLKIIMATLHLNAGRLHKLILQRTDHYATSMTINDAVRGARQPSLHTMQAIVAGLKVANANMDCPVRESDIDIRIWDEGNSADGNGTTETKATTET